MNILVLGGAGMLGHKLVQHLAKRFSDVRFTLRDPAGSGLQAQVPLLRGPGAIAGVDATDFPALQVLLRDLAPQVVVNCIGVIKQRSAAKSAVPSIQINALLPHLLAESLAEQGGRLIHFSTDCVFSGHKGNYAESDPSDAEDLYGKTKFLGEVAAPNALTLRTSIIGRELSHFASLLEWFLAQRGKTVRGFERVIYSGLTTNYLAYLVGDIIADHPTLHGLYQVASEPISKYDLLHMIREAFELDVTLEREAETVSDRSLDGTRFAAETGLRTPAWPDLIAALAADPTPYQLWRQK